MKTTSEILIGLHSAVASGNLDTDTILEIGAPGSRVQECEALDFKRQTPETDFEYAKTMRDIVAMHNSYGGFILFGVAETIKDKQFEPCGTGDKSLNHSKIRDLIKNYTTLDIRFNTQLLTVENKAIEAVWISKRLSGEPPVRFTKNGPGESPKNLAFKKGDVVFRRIDNNAIAQAAEDYDFLFSPRKPPSLELSINDLINEEPTEHNLPDRSAICSRFIGRGHDLGDLWKWLADDFSRVRLIAGEGGLGKTSIAYRFAEEIATRKIPGFNKVLWLSAKEKQFIPSEDNYRNISRVDYQDANSLYEAVIYGLGGIKSDTTDLDSRELLELALEYCQTLPSFLIIDDVDSLTQPDQLRILEFGMRSPHGTKILLTTRVNFSYSPDNVLKLGGFSEGDFSDYITILRDRYGLPALKEKKSEALLTLTGGSPLFTDSLFRLERRGLTIDQAMTQWKDEKGVEARKAALHREISELSKSAKRVLYAISITKSCSYIELNQILDYSDQTLGDSIQELSGLFLINAPSIAGESRYTIEPNTARLVQETVQNMGIDHAAILASTKRSRSDAIGIGLQRRSNNIGLAINQATALLRSGDSKGAVDVIQIASKKIKPHPDLLLAAGRFKLKLNPPAFDDAHDDLEKAYSLGQRKPLLFDLWFEAEYGRGALEAALEVATTAMRETEKDRHRWFERRAQIHVELANRKKSIYSRSSATSEIDKAIHDLRDAERLTIGEMQKSRIRQLIEQARSLRLKYQEQN
nr:RNA-binding domain-containing protein [uncultured Pseudomonas sp.]